MLGMFWLQPQTDSSHMLQKPSTQEMRVKHLSRVDRCFKSLCKARKKMNFNRNNVFLESSEGHTGLTSLPFLKLSAKRTHFTVPTGHPARIQAKKIFYLFLWVLGR